MAENDVYAGLEPRELWRHFGALNRIPRASHNEAAARAYVQQAADAAGARWQTDAYGNTVVTVPASPGREGAAPVVIQAHLDMVCEKRPDVVHDFSRDPIRPQLQGDRISATGTTFGADNGIGAAAALAAMTDPSVEHGPLELLFTVEEEIGLNGAANLDPALVSARRLINLDSENPRELTIGCAGGGGAILRLRVEREALPGWFAREVVVSGLKGGHSGVQIHERLANAIKLLTRALRDARAEDAAFRLVSVRGGNAHNAIPRDSIAALEVAPDCAAALERSVAATRAALRMEWGDDEPGLELEVREVESPGPALTESCDARLMALLDGLPHGVLGMSDVFPGKVETSSNLAQVTTAEDHVEIGTSTRSFVDAERDRVQAEIRALGEANGATVQIRDGYPGWEPNPTSELLATTKRVYEEQFGTPPEVQVIHAGLECGVIADRLPGLDAISFGPRIEGAHTPEECVYASTVASTWKLLCGLLKALSSESAGEHAPG
jgi:dipeptidase D